MDQFFTLFVSMISALIRLLESISFQIGGYSVSYAGIVFAVLGFFIITSLFWHGGKA